MNGRLPLLLVSVLVAAWAGPARGAGSPAGSLFPLEEVSMTNRPLVKAVLSEFTLRRHYPPREISARRETLEFLLDNMEACSVLAQAAGLIRYRATRDRQDRIWADDHAGARGHLTLVLVRPGQRVYYVEGTQSGLWDVRGRGIGVVNYKFVDADTIEYDATALIKVDNAVLAWLAQVFEVFVRGTVDRNFETVMRNPVTLCDQAIRTPEHLRKLIDQMPSEDKELLQPFRALLDTE